MLNNRFQEATLKPDAAFAQAYCYDEKFMGGKRAFTVSVAPKNESLSRGYEVALQEVQRVRQNGFTITELEREKKNGLPVFIDLGFSGPIAGALLKKKYL